jgi:dTDP-glucose 4,6-dehydratase
MHSKNVLITGGAGFIGSNFIIEFIKNNPSYNIINLDKLTYAGTLDNLTEVGSAKNYTFIKGDILDIALLNEIFEKHKINAVIHFAAESHVDNSITGPRAFLEANIIGTFNLLEVARKFWLKEPFVIKEGFENARFHHISTDEVYGTLSMNKAELFKETTPYAPNSPYSASKASSDMLVRAYFHTYGLNITISNCSNNYGFKQHDEKLIPTIIRKALEGASIPIYGDGKYIRDWIFVIDHNNAVDLIFHKSKAGETYNIGSNNEKTNLEIVDKICDILDKKNPRADKKSYKEQITFVKDRPGHDRRYAIDFSKLNKDFNWSPKESFESGLEKTIDWYIKKYKKN